MITLILTLRNKVGHTSLHTFAHEHMYSIAVPIAPVHKQQARVKAEADTYDCNALNFENNKAVGHSTLHTLAHESYVLICHPIAPAHNPKKNSKQHDRQTRAVSKQH